MSFFFDRFWFPDESRMTGIWRWPWRGDPEDARNMVLFTHVRLGPNQDGSVECDFLSSHLPWAFGGFHGVGPEGEPWLVVVQIAPTEGAGIDGNRWWAMVDGLERALHYNLEAEELSSVGMSRGALVERYERAGVDPDAVSDWPVTDLALGLLTEFTYVPLTRIVAGRARNCAFPEKPHDCRHDVFDDVFSAWVAGELPALDTSPELEYGDDEDQAGQAAPTRHQPAIRPKLKWPKARVKNWKTSRLRLQAVEEGWTADQARKASRKALTRYLTTWHRLPVRSR